METLADHSPAASADLSRKLVGTPSADALLALDEVLARKEAPSVAEIGVAIGATTFALAEKLAGKGRLYLFDFEEKVVPLKQELARRGFSNVTAVGNSRKTFDSYSWGLAKLRMLNIARQTPLEFDLVYLDGAHAFHHDATATAVVKEMMARDGYLLMDDYNWTFNRSPTMNPAINPAVAAGYNDEQLDEPHVKLICDVLLDTDPRFRRDTLGGRASKGRALYRRVAA